MGILKENCRLCQKDVGIIPLEKNLSTIILEVARIEINENLFEILPTSICLKCNNRILETNLFIKEIQSVDKYLRTCIKQYLDPRLTEVHPDGEKFENKSGLYKHITDTLVCPVCTKRCSRLSSYKKHIKTHSELYCIKCNIFFDNQNEYEHHKCENINLKDRKAHTRFKNKTTNTCDNAVNSPQNVSGNNYQCSKCEQSFEDKDSYTFHLKTHNNFICSEKNCLKVYTTAYSLKIHKLNHEGKRSFLCVSCGKDFISKKSLLCHEKIHAAVKAHRCDSCNINFSVRSNLRAHIKRYHEGVRYHCSQCPREFLTKCNLDRHEKIHTGIRDFKCDHCTSAFYTKKELMKHQRYHQGLKQHKCEQCFKTFFERHHLIIHLRSHSGERPYVCKIPECGKSFYDNQKLKRHLRAIHLSKVKS